LAVLQGASSLRADDVASVVRKLDEVNALREALAQTLDGKKEPITEATFQAVCAPAGAALQSWAQAEGHRARQVSDKFRNPKNKADANEAKVLAEFARNPRRLVVVEAQKLEGSEGFRIYRRIDVRPQCLYCHGEASGRPDFIKAKYPEDRAHGFRSGDLRGMYSVWIRK
jgi:hypothetical protein